MNHGEANLHKKQLQMMFLCQGQFEGSMTIVGKSMKILFLCQGQFEGSK